MKTEFMHEEGSAERSVAEVERSFRRRLRVVAGGLLAVTVAINVAPVAAGHLNVKTSDINNGAVTTPKLANGAVTTPKLAGGAVGTAKLKSGAVTTPKIDNGAVTRPKIGNRAVGGNKIARAVPGIAVAGADVNVAGNVLNSFSRFGGEPTVDKTGTGVYEIFFPGLEGDLGDIAIVVATVIFPTPGMITHAIGPNDRITIRTYNASGTPTDTSFDFVVMARRPVAAAGGAEAPSNDPGVD